MSTKTIALDSEVYKRLALLKGDSESFSKLINRMVDKTVTAHTVTEVLTRLDEEAPPLSDEAALTMQNVVRENRREEDWSQHDMS